MTVQFDCNWELGGKARRWAEELQQDLRGQKCGIDGTKCSWFKSENSQGPCFPCGLSVGDRVALLPLDLLLPGSGKKSASQTLSQL